tara:strand:+ start:109 stop:216 length:108 start_codon:yes stop_codon:yes gene_type:complete
LFNLNRGERLIVFYIFNTVKGEGRKEGRGENENRD